MKRPIRLGLLTISDRGAAGIYEDKSGPLLAETLTGSLNCTISHRAIIPDDRDTIVKTLLDWVETEKLDLIFTSGGTGFAPRDVTPEATRQVIERETPGLTLAMLQNSLAITPHAMLSRMAAGIRKQTLIINLPGSPKAARENLAVILPALPHAVELLQDDPAAEAHH